MTTYQARIEILDPATRTWRPVGTERVAAPTGTASDLGRRLLAAYLSEAPDRLGSARVQVWAAPEGVDTEVPEPSHVVALIDDPDPVPAEIAAVEAHREEVLRARRALDHSVEQLRLSVREASRAGHSDSRLARLAFPALTRTEGS